MKRIIEFAKGLSKRTKGILLSGVFSIVVLYYFFGAILASPNKYYFDKNGDGLLCYYYSSYQLKYDSAYWHIGASNYPYGESVFFSSDQPLITAALKFVNNNLFSTENSVAGVFNLLMLLSFCVCAIFVFLILYEFNTPYIFASIASVGIAFLSPQWARILAHFPLSYAFVIPVLLYLLIRFEKTPSFKKSFAIGSFVLLAACLHIYYIGFCGIILTVYFLFSLFTRGKNNFTFFKKCASYLIQLILPYLILQTCIYLSSNVSDRTNNPWGFLYYISNFDGIFYPYGRPYTALIEKHYTPSPVEQFEGLSFVGLLAVFTALIFLQRKICQLTGRRFKDFVFLSDYKMLNIFVLTGILGAIYACGIPYIYKPELVHYIGPLRQMRGLGRFAWTLFYILNIFCIYYLARVISLIKNKYLRVVIYTIPLAILLYDASCNIEPIRTAICNTIPELEDRNNELPQNKWIKEIDIKKYQAIIPLPYFLLGSENIGIEPEAREIFALTYIASLKTGLPITAAVLSRTSLSQAAKNMALVLEPYRPLQIIADFLSTKPFLILVREQDIKVNSQKMLLSKAVLIKNGVNFNLYEISYGSLKTYSDSLYNNTQRELSSISTFACNQFLSKKSSPVFVYKGFNEKKTIEKYRGEGAYEGKIKNYNRVFEDTVPNVKDAQDLVVSFWMDDFTKDLYSTSTLEIGYVDSTGHAYGFVWTSTVMHVKAIDGKWALIELHAKPNKRKDKILVTLWNDKFIDNSIIRVDELMIREEDNDLYRIFPGEIEKNNRFYLKK